MTNAAGQHARGYHDATKLSPPGDDGLTVDWSDQPRPYKLYRDLDRVPLPRQLTASKMTALAALAGRQTTGTPDLAASSRVVEARPLRQPPLPLGEGGGEGRTPGRTIPPDLATLATILHHSAGIIRRLRHRGGTMLFRAAPCTGALYHIELYAVCGPLPDLDAGVYHFDVHDFTLGQLRAGDCRDALAEASGSEPSLAGAPIIVVCTSTFWRNAWRYQARSYRHSYWDNGTILANLLAVAQAHGLSASVVAGFVDADVNRLLGVDGVREAALSLVALGDAVTPTAVPSPRVEAIDPSTVPISRREIEYPLIVTAHSDSSLDSPAAVATWRSPSGYIRPGEQIESRLKADVVLLLPGRVAARADVPPEPIEVVIARRGSARRFDSRPISLEALSTLLASAVAPVPLDVPGPNTPRLNDVYLIVHAVEGLVSGSYVVTRDRWALERLRSGDLRDEAGALAVSRDLAHSAAVCVYFLADLSRVGARYGPRGYRVAQLEASIMGGRLYLAAYALGLSASGLTFFDDEVTACFAPHAHGKDAMFSVAVGSPAASKPAEGGGRPTRPETGGELPPKKGMMAQVGPGT